MSLERGPKIRTLTEIETLSSIEIWRQNIIFSPNCNEEFRPFLEDDFEWGKKSATRQYRSLTTDTSGTNQKTAAQKSALVDLLLSQIANWSPLIPRNDIIKDCASLNDVWQRIRLFYNLQTTGAFLNECWNIKRGQNESPQALYARLKQCYDDNLLQRNGLNHIDGKLHQDEELTPTLHNSIILHWLEILHPRLRDLVTLRFSTELRNNTYALLFPEISRSLDGLLAELEDDASASRAYNSYNSSRRGPAFGDKRYQYKNSQNSNSFPYRDKPSYSNQSNTHSHNEKSCDYCRIMGKRAYKSHTIDECLFLKKQSRAATCEVDPDDISSHYEEFFNDANQSTEVIEHVLNRVAVYASPILTLYHKQKAYNVTLDSGATCNLLEEADAESMDCVIKPSNQRVRMADGKSTLEVVGETEVEFYRNNKSFKLNALVCRSTGTNILAGMSFLKDNDVAIRPATDEIIIDGKDIVRYDPVRKFSDNHCKRLTTYTIKSVDRSVILPGQSLSVPLPSALKTEMCVAIEPRIDSAVNVHHTKELTPWPKPALYTVNEGKISFTNDSKEPVMISKHEPICSIIPECSDSLPQSEYDEHEVYHSKIMNKSEPYSKPIQLNPDSVLTKEEEDAFRELLLTYDGVFNPVVGKYNGKSGSCFVEVNMGKTLPPQNKGRLPFYSRTNLQDLQDKFDELKSKGVFARPQDIGITVENVNTSFLVNKSNGDKRLVTDFNSIASYCRPTPSLMPDVDSTLRKIAGWKVLIKSDLTESYFQIPLKRSSMRYCGVVTPGKGLLVYTAGCMGLPGVEVALEELTCLILGDLVMEGKVAKVADDLFVGGDTAKEVCNTFSIVLQRFMDNNLKLSARKTIIAPKSTTILGWRWSAGKLTASPHRLNAIAQTKPPITVTAMKSFLGAYRAISRVMKGYAVLLAPLETAIRGKQSGGEKIIWSDGLTHAFKKAQEELKNAKTLTLPVPSDTLWIVTDAAVRPFAVGATLYVIRHGKPYISEFYNAKLPPFQIKWLPCEVEGLAISAALRHFSPFIIQSEHKPHVLTDSKACVQAVEKLSRGEFSVSARLCTFLSSVSRYGASVRHIAGHANLVSDYASRNPLECNSESCQICAFLKRTSESVVCNFVTEDVLQGRVNIPFTNRRSWKEIQGECSDIRKVIAHTQQGTKPNKKAKNLKMVRRYMSSKVVVAHDGVLVIRNAEPLSAVREQIVVPNQVLHGLLMVLHLRLGHPTTLNLQKVFKRYFFALNSNKAITEISQSCHQCASIAKFPDAMIPQSSEPPPESIGVRFASDILKRCSQKIIILRECVTSYTLAETVNRETAEDIGNSLVNMCSILRPSQLQPVIIRVDPAPAHQSLFLNIQGSSILKEKSINLELGRTLNINKNPVAEAAISELRREIKVICPERRQITRIQLSTAVANLNSRIRTPGLSAHEQWTQRDQVTGDQLPINDLELIRGKHSRREKNHIPSQMSKAPGRKIRKQSQIKMGSIVYLYADKNKEAARQRYIVTEIHDNGCRLRRFSSKLFGAKVYEVRLDEIYSIPIHQYNHKPPNSDSSDSQNSSDPQSEDSSDSKSDSGSNASHESIDIVSSEGESDNDLPDIPPELAANPDPTQQPVTTGRPGRKKTIPGHLKDYVLD